VYHVDDPRRTLDAPTRSGQPVPTRGADFVEFDRTCTSVARTQNAVVAYSEAGVGAVFELAGQRLEYAVLLPDADSAVRISHDGVECTVPGFSVSFVPPGDSAVEVTAAGRVIRILPVHGSGLADQATNAQSYATDNPSVLPLEPWPAPPGGWRVSSYSLDVPDEHGRFGRIFRGTTVMVNWLDVADGPRDPRRLSPHSHEDFEQCSLALEGSFTHHLRWPWTPNLAEWREDMHLACGPPSALVIPPGVVHTTQMTGRGRNVLVDIFCPPREDFVQKPGWVLNERDYS
jgi:hypothetical protein